MASPTTPGFYTPIEPKGGQAAMYCALTAMLGYGLYEGYRNKVSTADMFMSARRTTNRFLLGLSFFVSGLGSYVFFSPVQAGTYSGVTLVWPWGE